jgi:putative acetyltransferase
VHLRPAAWAEDPLSVDPRQTLELGWRLHRRAWGRGVATETAAALADDAFTRLGATRVAAAALPDHDASFRVMERLGMRYAGVRSLPGGFRCIEYGRDAGETPRPGPARVRIRPLGDEPAERQAVSDVLVEAFGGPGEAELVWAMIAARRSVMVLVAEDPGGGGVQGVAVLSAAGAPAGVACLGPVAVRADVRARGIGGRLVRAALTRAAEQGFNASAVLGDPAWYARFGYEPATPQGFTCRWTAEDAFMVRALEGGHLPPPGIIVWDPHFDLLAD